MNKPRSDEMLGKSPEFDALLRSLEIAAATDVAIILLGESGTGKELLARHVHTRSSRADTAFIAVNCAALPEGLAESEFFGHIKGAFTGAVSDNPGRISQAEGGTLFLDEVGEMSLDIQAKLLRFLESGEFQPVGSLKQRHANVRLIAATNADLREKVQQGSFREDLYYRLNIIPFHVPPLRERTGDVKILLDKITDTLADQYQLSPPSYTRAALSSLSSYPWPGNVRELRNLCERMLILFSGKEIDEDNLPREIRHQQSKRWTFSLPDTGIKLEELEQELLQQALEKTGGNQSKAARILGLTRYAFMYRLKKYQLT
jgi:transcriptional regulator with GAF, ATPase, and Fis domain